MELIRATGAAPILTLGHLAQLTGASHLYLREIVERTVDPYEDITRLKKNGGVRPISVPEPILMDVQRFILKKALRGLPNHPSSFAYQERRSIVDCASRHVAARWLIKLDLHDFFGQIYEPQVYGVFRSRGYAPVLALELARICTRVSGREVRSTQDYAAIPTYRVDRLGRLPQGAPTSGALANVVATGLDGALNSFAIDHGLVYTRYSDDLVFSSGGTFDRSAATSLIDEITETVSTHGFLVHRKKTRVVPPGSRRIVLGLLVDDNGVRLLPEFRRRVEMHIRGVEKFGLVQHARHRNFRAVFSFVNHVDGCLSFAGAVEPEWASNARRHWEEVLEGLAFPGRQTSRPSVPEDTAQ
jgi:RNA-directed DNA polymerase